MTLPCDLKKTTTG